MNIPNGFENATPFVFWSVAGVLAATSTVVWLSFMRAGSGARKGLAGAVSDAQLTWTPRESSDVSRR